LYLHIRACTDGQGQAAPPFKASTARGAVWRELAYGLPLRFYTLNGSPLAPGMRGKFVPWKPLRPSQRPLSRLAGRLHRLDRRWLEPLEVSAGTVSERIKASVTALELVSQYVDLKPTRNGAIGLCPFHNNHHPSFGVSAEGNY
jgi:hypothetical protein